jgi:hypothetical protein
MKDRKLSQDISSSLEWQNLESLAFGSGLLDFTNLERLLDMAWRWLEMLIDFGERFPRLCELGLIGDWMLMLRACSSI